MAIFNSYVSHNQRVCWVFSSIRVPRQNIKQCMRPRSCDATTRKITMLPRYPPPTCQKINVLKLPNSGFPQKTGPKGRKFKGNIQNLEGGVLWSSGYWLPLCHIYISIQWPVQLHQSNLHKNLQISFLPQKFLAFHAPVALLAVLTRNKNSRACLPVESINEIIVERQFWYSPKSLHYHHYPLIITHGNGKSPN